MKQVKVSLSCALLLCSLLLGGCTADQTAFTVNGLAVEQAEVVYYMRENSAIVAAELEDEGLDSSRDDFWTSPQNGVDTFARLQDYTVRAIARVKLEQLLAADYGIETPLSYREQQRAYEDQNRQRKAAFENGEVLYGPVERDFVTYFHEWYLEMQDDLIAALEQDGVLQVTTRQVEAYYQANPSYFEDVSREEAEHFIRVQLLEEAYVAHLDHLLDEARLNTETLAVRPEDIF